MGNLCTAMSRQAKSNDHGPEGDRTQVAMEAPSAGRISPPAWPGEWLEGSRGRGLKGRRRHQVQEDLCSAMSTGCSGGALGRIRTCDTRFRKPLGGFCRRGGVTRKPALSRGFTPHRLSSNRVVFCPVTDKIRTKTCFGPLKPFLSVATLGNIGWK